MRQIAFTCLKPLTSEDVKLLERNGAEVRRMMSLAGMPSISGHYLLVDTQNSAWRGQWYDRKIVRIAKRFSGYYISDGQTMKIERDVILEKRIHPSHSFKIKAFFRLIERRLGLRR